MKYLYILAQIISHKLYKQHYLRENLFIGITIHNNNDIQNIGVFYYISVYKSNKALEEEH